MSHICQKCVTCCQKTWRGCQTNLKFCTEVNYLMPRKRCQNNLLVWGPQHGQNGIWNLQIFLEYLHHLKIFGILFLGLCSTRPHNLIHIQPKAIDFFVNFVAAVDSVQLIPKYKWKVKLRSWGFPNIFVWNNWTSRKWGLCYRSGLNL